MAISDWPIQGLTIDLLRRELYDSREGDWDFFTKKKTKRFVISSPGSFRYRWKWAEMTLSSRLKKKQFQEDNKSNTYKCFIDQVKGQFGRILTQWRICDPQKKLTRKLFFFQAQTLQWLYFTVVFSVSLRYIIKKRKLLPQKGSTENTSAKCAYEKLVNGELNPFHSGYFT